MAGKGGVSLAFQNRLKTSIKDEGILPSGRAIWAKLQNDKMGSVGILGIYAPNEPHDRTALWKELFNHLDFGIQWIVLGDFNMIERSSDQRGGNRTVIHVEEKHA